MGSAEHKIAVREAFSKSALHYDSVAEIQRRIASALLSRRPEIFFETALDAGCGTAFVARCLGLNHPGTRILALDQAPGMCLRSGLKNTICGDIEALPLASDSLELYVSSLAWQWVDPLKASQEAARVLKPGGRLALATLGPASLHELREAFSGLDDFPHVLDFHSAEDYAFRLETAGFEAIEIRNEPVKVYRNTLTEILRELRTLGAHSLKERRPGLLGRRAWQGIQARYEAFREPEGLPLTYDTLYLHAKKAS